MKREQWLEMFSTINADNNLNKSNVIERIQERLNVYPKEYQKWGEAGFDLNHWFKVQSAYSLHEFALLHIAAESDYIGVVNALIDRGADVNAKDEYGWSPLHCAAIHGSIEVINALIDRGADVNAKGEQGQVPLQWAALFGQINAVNALIDRGADVDAKDEQGKTPLCWAAIHVKIDVVNALIDRGADINAKDEQGMTPLCWAALFGHEDVTKILIQKTLIQDFSIQRPGYLTGAFSTYWDRCLNEVKKLKEENKLLYDFSRESDTKKLFEQWKKNENVCSKFDDQESLKKQYPEYAHILINKANETKKEIFLDNHKPLIDVLSKNYREGFQKMSFTGVKNFLTSHGNDYSDIQQRTGITLMNCFDFEDIKEKHVPKLKLMTFAERIKSKYTGSSLKHPSTEQLQALNRAHN